MHKIKVLLKAPVLVAAGYGAHSREIFQALVSDPLFDVYVESINWGGCSYLTDNSPLKESIKRCTEKWIAEKHQGNNKYDLFIHVTIPNEFERLGTYNVGVTAGIETDRVSHVWVQKCNEMDLVIVPSEHSKTTLTRTVVDWQNPSTGERGQMRVEKPVIVCPEGVDVSVFRPELARSPKIDSLLEGVPEFCFLSAGQWGSGGFGEDRKNVATTIKYFIEEFYSQKNVGLVLKLNMGKNTEADYNTIVSRIKEIKALYNEAEVPPITLIHGNLTDNEMGSLYTHPKIKAFLSLTHGEGWGRHFLEAAACDLPILATNWSGQLDFLSLGKFGAIEYALKEIPEKAVWEPILIKGSQWAEVDERDVKAKMRKIVAASTLPKEWAQELGTTIREKYELGAVVGNVAQAIKQKMLESTSQRMDPLDHLRSFVDTPENFNVIYTMPMSTGDVFISTAIIDGLFKNGQLPEDAKIYFATLPQYADVLKGNPHIYKVIPWNESLLTMDLLEEVFDLALTPNTATQYVFSNWIRRGQGKLLAEEFANHCHTKLGDYHIEKEEVAGLPETFMTLHVGSGKGQWEARKYDDWNEVVLNIKSLYPSLAVVQIGGADEMTVNGVDVDLRGKTNYQQSAYVLSKSVLHLSIDTFTAHVAAALATPLVAIYGCSYASSTGPWYKDWQSAKCILLQSERLTGCKDKACYKNRCAKNADGNGPINEIDPKEIFQACEMLLRGHQ